MIIRTSLTVVAGLLAALLGCAGSLLALRYGWVVPVVVVVPLLLLLIIRDKLATDAQHELQATLEPALWDLLLDHTRHELRRLDPGLRAGATSVVSQLRTLTAAAALDALLLFATAGAGFATLITVRIELACAVLAATVAFLAAMAWMARDSNKNATDLLDDVLSGIDEIHLYAAERRMLTRLLPKAVRRKSEPRLAALAAAAPLVLAATVLGTAHADELLAACAVLAQLVLALGPLDNTARSILVVGAETVRGVRRLLDAAKATAATQDPPDLRIEAGEFLAITGPSGVGKTALLDRLSRVDRDATGYVVQDADAPRGNVRTVVVGGTAAGDDEAWRALEVVGLSDAIRRLPMGLSTVVTDGSGGFSATQIQLMQLARALARRPRLLLLDEPPVAVAGALRSREGVTRVVVTCSPSLLDAADRVITLGEGAPTNTETRWGKS